MTSVTDKDMFFLNQRQTENEQIWPGDKKGSAHFAGVKPRGFQN